MSLVLYLAKVETPSEGNRVHLWVVQNYTTDLAAGFHRASLSLCTNVSPLLHPVACPRLFRAQRGCLDSNQALEKLPPLFNQQWHCNSLAIPP